MKSTTTKIIIIVILIALFIGGTMYFRRDKTNTEITDTTENTNSSQTDGSSYKNGSYNAQGSYASPAGQENIDVTLVIENDKVIDANVVGSTPSPVSQNFQADFIRNFKAQVIGKDLASLNLTKVSGSSLTPKGFNDAVTKIKAEASI